MFQKDLRSLKKLCTQKQVIFRIQYLSPGFFDLTAYAQWLSNSQSTFCKILYSCSNVLGWGHGEAILLENVHLVSEDGS